MNIRQVVSICLAAALIQITACSKAPAERIAEIDRLLAAPFTGTPEDADRRGALRAERAALAGSNNNTVADAQSAAVAHQAAQANADERERARQIALQQENFRNIEQRQREQAAREREQASSHSRYDTRPNGRVYGGTTHSEVWPQPTVSGYGQTSGYPHISPHP